MQVVYKPPCLDSSAITPHSVPHQSPSQDLAATPDSADGPLLRTAPMKVETDKPLAPPLAHLREHVSKHLIELVVRKARYAITHSHAPVDAIDGACITDTQAKHVAKHVAKHEKGHATHTRHVLGCGRSNLTLAQSMTSTQYTLGLY